MSNLRAHVRNLKLYVEIALNEFRKASEEENNPKYAEQYLNNIFLITTLGDSEWKCSLDSLSFQWQDDVRVSYLKHLKGGSLNQITISSVKKKMSTCLKLKFKPALLTFEIVQYALSLYILRSREEVLVFLEKMFRDLLPKIRGYHESLLKKYKQKKSVKNIPLAFEFYAYLLTHCILSVVEFGSAQDITIPETFQPIITEFYEKIWQLWGHEALKSNTYIEVRWEMWWVTLLRNRFFLFVSLPVCNIQDYILPLLSHVPIYLSKQPPPSVHAKIGWCHQAMLMLFVNKELTLQVCASPFSPN